VANRSASILTPGASRRQGRASVSCGPVRCPPPPRARP